MYGQVHMHVRRTSMTELPTSDEELASWCHKAFATKVVPSVPMCYLVLSLLLLPDLAEGVFYSGSCDVEG
jgi:hypothetical protein